MPFTGFTPNNAKVRFDETGTAEQCHASESVAPRFYH